MRMVSGRTRIFRQLIALILSVFIAVLPVLQLFSPAQADASVAVSPHVFKEEVVPNYNFYLPTDFAITPDGRTFVTEKSGKIKIIQNGAVLPQPFTCTIKSSTDPEVCAITIAANRFGEQGLLGITLDPQFASNHYVYVMYTNQSPAEYRISRLTESNNQAVSGSEKILFHTAVNASAGTHFGGGLRFGPDGKIWFTTGEQETPSNSQNLSNYLGKLMRINADGTIPSDNPFVGQAGEMPEIWAYGLRNPFKFSFLPNGLPVLGDVGGDLAEEVDTGVKGGNFGWPTCEGPCTTSGMINPTYTYYHGGTASTSAAIAGGMVYTGSQFPTEYQNKYFFGDYVRGYIHYIDLNNTADGEHVLDAKAGSPIAIQQGTDGSIYYLSIYPVGKLYRIKYSLANQAPNATIAADKTNGSLPLTVTFSSAGSNDPDGNPITYKWDFGDGSTSTEQNPIHTYTTKGKYVATLVVNDGSLNSDTASLTISAGYMAPQITITSPVENTHYNAGDTISYSATATDSQDGTLPASAYAWTMRMHHLDHYHPFLTANGVTSGSFVIPNNAENSPYISYDVTLTVTDTDNLKTTLTRTIYPNEVNLSVDSTPAQNLQFDYDGITFATPHITKAVVGYHIELNAQSPVSANGITYQFDSWSDGGTQRHTITVPNTDVTYTAKYVPTSYALNPGETKSLPPYSVVSGDVRVNGTPLYDNDGTTGLVIMLEQSASVSAQWGAMVTTNNDATTGDTTRTQIASQVKASGCGGSGCASVVSYKWPSGAPTTGSTPYQLPAGQTVHVPQYAVVSGDIKANGATLYDSDGKTGLVTKFEQAADVIAPWGAVALNNTDETGATATVQNFVNDMKLHGCGSSCTSVTSYIYPTDLPTPTPTPYQIGVGQTLHVLKYTVIQGDIKVNGTALYDNDGATGLITKFEQEADVMAPWGAVGTTTSDESQATAQANAYAADLKQHGCGGSCTSVQMITWPQSAPTTTPNPLPSPQPTGASMSATPNPLPALRATAVPASASATPAPLPQPRVTQNSILFLDANTAKETLTQIPTYADLVTTESGLTRLVAFDANTKPVRTSLSTETRNVVSDLSRPQILTQLTVVAPETLVILYGTDDYNLMGTTDKNGAIIDLNSWKASWEAFYQRITALPNKPKHLYILGLGSLKHAPTGTGKLPAFAESTTALADQMDTITKNEAQTHGATFIDIRSETAGMYEPQEDTRLTKTGNIYIARLLLNAMGVPNTLPLPEVTPVDEDTKAASPTAILTPAVVPSAQASSSALLPIIPSPLPSPRSESPTQAPSVPVLPTVLPKETDASSAAQTK